MNRHHAALLPFANYYRRLTDGRRNYPKTGVLHGFDEGCPTEAVITIEDLKRALDLTLFAPSWSPRVQAAYAFAKQKHEGEFRRDGVTPYINHIDEVMGRVGDDELDLIVAACHDLVKNKRTTYEEIEAQPFWNAAVTDGILALTRRPSETYSEYILRVKKHHGGRWVSVKIADNLANLADSPTPSQIKRYASSLLTLVA